MLAEYLPVLCRLMQWTFFCTPTPASFVSRLYTMAPHEIQPASDPTASRKQVVRTKLDLRSILGRTLTKSLEEILLDPFGEMIIGCQSVVITGVQHVSLPRVESLREIMSAEAVFTKAMVWKMLRLAKIMKWKAYDLIRKVDYERAMDSYMLLIDAHQSSFLFRLPRNSYAGDTGVVASLLLRTMIDAAVTIAWLGLKLGDFKQVHDFQHIGQEIGGFLTNLPLPENMLMPDQGRFPPCIQGGAWLDLLLDVLTRGNVYYTLEQGVSGLTNMKQGMIQFGAIVSHISCDLTLLQGLLNNHMVVTDVLRDQRDMANISAAPQKLRQGSIARFQALGPD